MCVWSYGGKKGSREIKQTASSFNRGDYLALTLAPTYPLLSLFLSAPQSVNPNLAQNKASVYEAWMLGAIIHLCFAQFRGDYTLGAFVTDIRVGEKQLARANTEMGGRGGTDENHSRRRQRGRAALVVFAVVNLIYGRVLVRKQSFSGGWRGEECVNLSSVTPASGHSRRSQGACSPETGIER